MCNTNETQHEKIQCYNPWTPDPRLCLCCVQLTISETITWSPKMVNLLEIMCFLTFCIAFHKIEHSAVKRPDRAQPAQAKPPKKPTAEYALAPHRDPPKARKPSNNSARSQPTIADARQRNLNSTSYATPSLPAAQITPSYQDSYATAPSTDTGQRHDRPGGEQKGGPKEGTRTTAEKRGKWTTER